MMKFAGRVKNQKHEAAAGLPPPFPPPALRSAAMQQAKISAFFKPAAPTPPLSDQFEPFDLPDSRIVTYKRRPIADPTPGDGDHDPNFETDDGTGSSQFLNSKPAGKILNKKRSYAQYHLDLGQSDFLLHSCTVCGVMYARGDEDDETLHRKFHDDYHQGIQFKGWQNERVVSTPCGNGDRVVLVLDGDPQARKHKVRQVAKIMERELGFSEGQLIHKLCKVYLYISSRRVVGCLVAEPIKTAHRGISSLSCNNTEDTCTTLDSLESKVCNKDLRGHCPAVLQFGNFSFQREFMKKDSSRSNTKVDNWDSGAILCEEEAVPALCGIRAIWVVPSNRREGIASLLLDAARYCFCMDETLEPFQFAFSSPTSAGRALASTYTGIAHYPISTMIHVS